MRAITIEVEKFLNQISPSELNNNSKLIRKVERLKRLLKSQGALKNLNLCAPGGGGGGIGPK